MTRRDRIITGLVGIVASIACAVHVWQLMLWQLYGAPADRRQNWALLGSLMLLVSSVVVLFNKPRRAAVGSLVALVPLWIFYVPASAEAISEARFSSALIVPLTPPILLLAATVMAARHTIVMRRAHD